jgi:hypothetical protein
MIMKGEAFKPIGVDFELTWGKGRVTRSASPGGYPIRTADKGKCKSLGNLYENLDSHYDS